MPQISLDNWTVAGYWPWTPMYEKSVENGMGMNSMTPFIPAKVPGSVYDDLLRAGLIADPDLDMNSLLCEWVANRWWVYRCHFPTPTPTGTYSTLVFEGIDYEAVIYFNGIQVATHEGMYTQCRMDITGLLKDNGENALEVIIKSAPEEMGEIGYTSLTRTQKARFNYKWDFSTRLVNLGLYGKVYIEQTGAASLLHPSVRVVDARAGNIHFETAIGARQSTKAQLVITISDPEGNTAISASRSLNLAAGETAFSADFVLDNPQLWWPNGYGSQPLYQFSIEIADDWGGDSYRCNIGLRDISYEQCDDAPSDALPYLLRVNGKRIYIKGANVVPLDMLYGCVPDDDYERLVGDIAKNANMNLLRVWGGGIIETEQFYDTCDRHGMLVWQEFIQSSSGIENIPSTDPHFLKLLEKTVYAAVYGRRNHPSLVIWGGGNELLCNKQTPVSYDNENIARIKAITDRLDPDRLFLPTSGSGPLLWLDPDQPGCNHDVHGSWKYGGAEAHYGFYDRSDSQLHSEFGCNGMSSEQTIRHICSPSHIGVLDNEDYVWRFHGDWWNDLARDIETIGKPKDLTEMIKIDQFLQAEGLRYIIEANSRRAFCNCGSIIWVLNEPWPNVANCSLIDHYFDKKLACKLVGNVFAPLHASMRYSSLYLKEGAAFTGELFLHSDCLDCQKVTLQWSAYEEDGKCFASGEIQAELEAGARDHVGTVCLTGTGKPITVVLKLLCGSEVHENRYLFLPHLGSAESPERRTDIDAVVSYVDTADNWLSL